MAKILTNNDISQHYSKLIETPSFINTLNRYEKEEVYKYAKKQLLDATGFIYKIISNSPNYKYPEKDIETPFQHFADRHWPYIDANMVIHLIKASNTTKEAKPERLKQKNNISFEPENENFISELPKLYNLMINEYKLIATDTTIEQFTAVFTGQPIGSFTPLKWNTKIVLLAYFIMQLVNHYKILEFEIWATAENCFKNQNRKKLRQSYGNSLDNTNPSHKGKPKGHFIIDRLFI